MYRTLAITGGNEKISNCFANKYIVEEFSKDPYVLDLDVISLDYLPLSYYDIKLIIVNNIDEITQYITMLDVIKADVVAFIYLVDCDDKATKIIQNGLKTLASENVLFWRFDANDIITLMEGLLKCEFALVKMTVLA